MGGELILKDLRPFFFQVIDVGKKIGIFSEADFASLRKEGAEMTIELADRHYTLVSQAHVWQSAYDVAGVLSLALTEKFKGDPDKAAKFIKTKGLIPAFQHGWGLILKLKTLADFLPHDIFKKERVEKELCEYFMADPHNTRWEGQKKFKELTAEAIKEKRQDEWHDWAIRRWSNKKDPELMDLISDFYLGGIIITERKRDIINTFFFSLLLKDTPFAPLGDAHLRYIQDALVDDIKKSSEAKVEEKIATLMPDIPKDKTSSLSIDLEKFLSHTLPILRNELQNPETEKDGRVWMKNHLFVKNSPFSSFREIGIIKKRGRKKK